MAASGVDKSVESTVGEKAAQSGAWWVGMTASYLVVAMADGRVSTLVVTLVEVSAAAMVV